MYQVVMHTILVIINGNVKKDVFIGGGPPDFMLQIMCLNQLEYNKL